ncbi:hypothetical protein AYO45_06260 [Gammaproteobacteria bacterium SCGC AG-212-F23]|nr:hypothetical protein AYO45_06260 [Gammaproteobacteria bacterium SCGC AG-212-F23]
MRIKVLALTAAVVLGLGSIGAQALYGSAPSRLHYASLSDRGEQQSADIGNTGRLLTNIDLYGLLGVAGLVEKVRVDLLGNITSVAHDIC